MTITPRSVRFVSSALVASAGLYLIVTSPIWGVPTFRATPPASQLPGTTWAPPQLTAGGSSHAYARFPSSESATEISSKLGLIQEELEAERKDLLELRKQFKNRESVDWEDGLAFRQFDRFLSSSIARNATTIAQYKKMDELLAR
jgi:hypothetical protein